MAPTSLQGSDSFLKIFDKNEKHQNHWKNSKNGFSVSKNKWKNKQKWSLSLNNHWKHKQKWVVNFKKGLGKQRKVDSQFQKPLENKEKTGEGVWRAVWEQSGDTCVETSQSGANLWGSAFLKFQNHLKIVKNAFSISKITGKRSKREVSVSKMNLNLRNRWKTRK